MITKEKSREILWIVLLASILFIYYLTNLQNINAIWELPDEAGYLYNAAYFTGKNWNSYTLVGNAYYGYGYSLILIPFFLLCKTGINLIKSAILLNYILVIISYFLQIYIYSKIFRKCSLYLLGASAFVTSFFSYVFVSANKVLCETFLSLQIWVISIIFYKLFTTNRKKYYILLSFASVYIYMTHARALAVLASVCIILLVYACVKRQKKSLLLFFVFFIIFLGVGTFIKNDIIKSLYSNNVVDTETMGNVIDKNFILQRLSWLLNISNLGAYFVSACCRLYYIIIASVLTIIWSFKYIWTETLKKVFNIVDWKTEDWIRLYFILIFIVMFILCCLSGAGIRSDFTYSFYGRYIEYVLTPLIGIGVLSYLNIYCKNNNYIMLILIILGLITSMELNYLDSNSIRPDTSRIAGFTYWITKNDNYLSFIYSQTLLLICSFTFICLLKRMKQKWHKIIFVFVIVLFLLNNKDCIKIINNVNEGKSKELAIINNVLHNIDDEKIYFINKDYSYKWNCIRMQVYLMNESMIILNMDNYSDYILEEAYIIAYTNTTVSEDLAKQFLFIMDAGEYSLYKNKL